MLVGCEVAFPIHDDVSARASSPCRAEHRFCADFDEGGLGAHPEWVPFASAGGALDVDTSASRSQPGALVASSPSLAADAPPAFAFVGPKLAGRTDEMRLAFAMRVDARGSGGAPLATLGVVGALGTLYTVQIGVGSGGAWELDEYRPGVPHEERLRTSDVAVGEGWKSVVLDVRVGDDTATLTVDGGVVFDKVPLAPTQRSGAPSVAIGLTSLYGPTSAWRVRFDDVTVD